MMTRCPSCPLGDRPEPCHAQATAAPNFCSLIARGREDYRRFILEKSLGTWVGPPAEGRTPPTVSAILLYKSCDYRGPVAQCGCTPLRVCYLGKGSRPDPEASYGHVTERDCLACVSGGET